MNPAPTRPQHDGSRAFNQVCFEELLVGCGCAELDEYNPNLRLAHLAARLAAWRRQLMGSILGPPPAGFKSRQTSMRAPPHGPPQPTWRHGAPLLSPERGRGRPDTSCGTSEPALGNPNTTMFPRFQPEHD